MKADTHVCRDPVARGQAGEHARSNRPATHYLLLRQSLLPTTYCVLRTTGGHVLAGARPRPQGDHQGLAVVPAGPPGREGGGWWRQG
eukprot:scaffold40463_cov53-Phaeocystis_antarctica.AAC.4